ncbi:MAG: glycosyltransferase [Saprospiraceae bacterium]|nr:glycosyltransferase [Saprospiraceae bacterium]
MKCPYLLHLPKWYPNKTDTLEGIFVRRHIDCTDYACKSVILYIRAAEIKNKAFLYESEKINTSNSIEYKVYYKKQITGIQALDKVLKFIVYYLLSLRWLITIYKEHGKPSLVMVHVLLRQGFTAWMLKVFFNIPYLIIEHSTFYLQNYFTPIENIKNKLRKFVLIHSNGLMAVSNNLLFAMSKIGLSNPNSLQVYNSVNTQIFYPKKRLKDQNYNVLHVSEFNDAHKNVLGILRAFQNMLSAYPNIHLHLVGYGRDTNVILQHIQKNGLQNNIHYKGQLEGETLANEYRNADVFVLFSNKENMPCVIAESLCCGTPVIATRVGGIPEIINSSNGVLIDVGDEKALTKAITQCFNSEHIFDRDVIAINALQLFSENSVGESLLKIYTKIKPDLVK